MTRTPKRSVMGWDAAGSQEVQIAVSGSGKLLMSSPPDVENKRGSDCNGSDGDANRVLTLANTALSSNEFVVVNGLVLHADHDYTVSHKSASSTITFLNAIDDSAYIAVRYYT